MVKNWTVQLDEVIKDERGSRKLKGKVDNGIQVVLEDYYLEVSGECGDNGGGIDSLELYEDTGGSTGGNKRFRGHA